MAGTIRICSHNIDGFGSCDIMADGVCVQGPCHAEELVEYAPVVHGRWTHLGGDEWCCPVCGFVITTEGSWDKPAKKYCEDCGAKMDGGADHEDRQD